MRLAHSLLFTDFFFQSFSIHLSSVGSYSELTMQICLRFSHASYFYPFDTLFPAVQRLKLLVCVNSWSTGIPFLVHPQQRVAVPPNCFSNSSDVDIFFFCTGSLPPVRALEMEAISAQPVSLATPASTVSGEKTKPVLSTRDSHSELFQVFYLDTFHLFSRLQYSLTDKCAD